MKRILCLLLVFTPSLAAADKVWNSGKGVTWDCKKDPVVTVNHAKGSYTFKGACKSVTFNGSSVKAKVESADSLTITGARGDVTVATVGSITVSGAQNKVTWGKAQTGDAPAISNSGVDNAITQAGAVAAAPPAAATDAKPAAGAGKAIDCAKSPSFVTSDNNGTFTLTGPCKQVLISGNNNKLKIENAAFVALTGNENVVDGATLTSVDASGNKNTVTYKGTKPKWSSAGNGNKISATK